MSAGRGALRCTNPPTSITQTARIAKAAAVSQNTALLGGRRHRIDGRGNRAIPANSAAELRKYNRHRNRAFRQFASGIRTLTCGIRNQTCGIRKEGKRNFIPGTSDDGRGSVTRGKRQDSLGSVRRGKRSDTRGAEKRGSGHLGKCQEGRGIRIEKRGQRSRGKRSLCSGDNTAS